MKIITLDNVRKTKRLTERRDSSDPMVRIEAELDYRTEKLVEALDEANSRIESLEKQLLYLVSALKQNLTRAD